MNFLPQASGTRPRVACDISAQGVVAARSDTAEAVLAATARVELRAGAVMPSLKPGNIVDRVEVVAAVRKALEDVGMKPNARDADVSLVVPDSAVRVSMLEFDSLPTKLTEALPLVRFRLKKMLPFDADDAMVTFQTMSSSKTLTRVLAVAIPRDVLGEYEGAVREAGYEPGAVIPSTLAALAAIDEDPALVVNANLVGVTAAIVRGGIVMLHRSVDLQMEPVGTPANVPVELLEPSPATEDFAVLPLVDVHDSAGEWAMQEAMPEHGRNPYADRAADEAAVQNVDGRTGLADLEQAASQDLQHERWDNDGLSQNIAVAHEPGDLRDSPYAYPTLTADLNAELHNAILIAPTSIGTLTEEGGGGASVPAVVHVVPPAPIVEMIAPIKLQEEIAQAVSVAVAYFEDTLAIAPETILSAGPLGAVELNRMLQSHGLGEGDGLGMRELVRNDAIAPDAAGVPRGWLSGVRGALRG